MDNKETKDMCSEPVAAYGRQASTMAHADMPCNFSPEELMAEIDESEHNSFLSHDAFTSKMAAWGICR